MVEATFMMKNGYLSKSDVVGSQYFQDANGNINEGTIINLRHVDFGGLKLETCVLRWCATSVPRSSSVSRCSAALAKSKLTTPAKC